MEIDGQRLDVVTEGEFLAAGTAIRILYVQGARVVVAAEPGPNVRAGERGSVGRKKVELRAAAGWESGKRDQVDPGVLE